MWKDNLVPYSFQKRDIYYFSRRVPKDLEILKILGRVRYGDEGERP